MSRRDPIAGRFWSRVDFSNPNGCWLWTGSRRHTYGEVWRDGVKIYTHRAAYEMVHGLLPPGVVVRHACDTPLCVRPDHLLRGTQADNIADAWERGRASGPPHGGGECHPGAKLSDAQVDELVRHCWAGSSVATLAVRFGLSATHVRTLVRRGRGTTWGGLNSRERERMRRHADARGAANG